MSAMTLKEVTRRFVTGNRSFPAVDNVSLTVRRGQRLALVGPSGSGKTTLLNLMGALDRPDGGTVQCLGVELSTASERKAADFRRKHLGFVFQQDALVPELTVHENVELPLLLNGLNAKERRTRIMELLDAVGLADRAKHRPDQLSGGQQQRVAIARALAPRPLIVLADEPTANLDTANGEQAMEIMQRLNQETGTAFVFATHDPRVMAFARRIVELRDGQIINNGLAQ